MIFRANEICKSKGKSKITVKDVLEAMEKAGFNNFKPEIDSLLFNIEKDANNTHQPKKRQAIEEDINNNNRSQNDQIQIDSNKEIKTESETIINK